MKKGLVFFLGVVTGCILTSIILLIIGRAYNQSSHSDVVIANQITEFTTANRFEVFQVLGDGALANCEEDRGYSRSYFTGPVVYIISDGQNLFYDDQIIEVPRGKRPMQIGTYRYQTQMGEKVVPVIEFQ